MDTPQIIGTVALFATLPLGIAWLILRTSNRPQTFHLVGGPYDGETEVLPADTETFTTYGRAHQLTYRRCGVGHLHFDFATDGPPQCSPDNDPSGVIGG